MLAERVILPKKFSSFSPLHLTGADRDLYSEEYRDQMYEISHRYEGLEDKPPTPNKKWEWVEYMENDRESKIRKNLQFYVSKI